MHTYREPCSAAPATAWALYARPQRWHEWAPHIRGAWGLSGPDGEVREGARGAARLLGALPVPARIVHVEEGRAWTWQVGPVTMTHRIEPPAGAPDAARGATPATAGCTLALDLSAPGPLEAATAAAYGPVVRLMLRRLASTAAVANLLHD